MKRLFSFLVLIAIVAIFGFLSFEVLSGFLLPLFLAVMLVVIFRPMHLWLTTRLGGRGRTAAAITTLSVLLIILLPSLWILSRAASESLSLVSHLDEQSLLRQADEFRKRFDLDLPSETAMVRITQIDSALRHLAEPGAVLPDELQQNRQKATVELVLLTGQLGNELLPDHQVQPEGDSSTGGKRRVQLEELLHEFQDQLQALVAARGDDAKFRVALAGATQTFEQLPLALYGGPVRLWLKQAVRFDASQVDSIRNEVRQLAGPLAVGTTQYVGSVLLQVIVVLAVMSVALYYFLADGPDMVDHLASLTPLENRYEQQLLDQFSALLRAILIAMLLSAFVQGLLAAAAYLWFGFDSVFLLTVLTMVLAIVPFVGAIPVWGSCALWLFLHDGRPQAAIALAIYGIVIGVVGDNVIKPMVLHGRSNLHPLLGLLSVLGGAQALGPIGIIVGPMAVALLQTLLIMLRAELAVLDIRGQETRPIDTPLPS